MDPQLYRAIRRQILDNLTEQDLEYHDGFKNTA